MLLSVCVCVRACVCGGVGVGARPPAYACTRVALLIQHASAAFQPLQHFSTLSYKRHGFRKNVIEYKMCILVFYTHFI